MPTGWFLSGTPPLNQLGATMGVGVTSQPYNPFSNPDYVNWLNDQAEEQRRQFDQDYGLKKQQLDQQYAIARQQAKSASERNALDKWYQQQQVQLAQDRLAMEDRQFNMNFGEQQRQFNTNLGYNLLNSLSQLHGPSDYFAASNLARGVAAQPGSAVFLNALRDNIKLPGFGAQAGAPTAETGNTLMAKLSGQPVSGGTTFGAANAAGLSPSLAGTGSGARDAANSYVNQIHALAARGGQGIGAGVLEQLSPDEFDLFKAGLEAPDEQGNAYSAPAFLDQWRRSRIGQSVGSNYRLA